MNTTTRTYTMRARAEAVEATRDRIARAAMKRFIAEPYEHVTIASVAGDAGVSHQTVLNHFASKEGLFTAAAERFTADLRDRRAAAQPRDTSAAVALLLEEYEESGDGNVRLAAVDQRFEAVRAAIAVALAAHQEWLGEVFAARLPDGGAKRGRALAALHAATDVTTWKLLRRDLGLSRAATQQVMTDAVEAILDGQPRGKEQRR
jgi:AcrR family transcriptional regulator